MVDLNVLKSLRIISLAEADDQTLSAWHKSLCRWYSREFHTPLHLVLEMPAETIFTVYYEDMFWNLKTGSEKQQEALNEIIATVLSEEDPNIQIEEQNEEQEDDVWYQEELEALDKKLGQKDDQSSSPSKTSQTPSFTVKNPNLEAEFNDLLDDASHLDDEG